MEVFIMDEMTNEVVVEQQTEQQEEQKTFTREEVMELLQKESDKRVSQALKKVEKKYEKKLSLSRLDGDEREKAEKDSRIAELEEQVASFQIERNKSELKSVLSSRGLSAEFADIIVIGDDIEAAQENISRLDKLFKQAVKAEVERRLAGATVPKGNGSGIKTEGLKKEDIKNIPLSQIQKMKNENPEEYKRLFG